MGELQVTILHITSLQISLTFLHCQIGPCNFTPIEVWRRVADGWSWWCLAASGNRIDEEDELHQRSSNIAHLCKLFHSPFCISDSVLFNSTTIEGNEGGSVVWSCCLVGSNSSAISRIREFNVMRVMKRHIFINFTHLFTVLVAFPAISGQSKSVREVWVAGAAVWLTAAAVTSPIANSNARSMQCNHRWWLRLRARWLLWR